MNASLYLIPVTLGDTPYTNVLPEYNFSIIRSIKTFIVENEKSARRFLSKIEGSHVDDATYYELSEHTEIKNITHYLDAISKGEDIGVISEAGCPCVADPGSDIVSIAQSKNIKVVPLVGPSSILMAIMASGFSGQSFAFNGYLPAKPAERMSKLKSLESRCYKEDQTQAFIETPYRNEQMFDSIIKSLKPTSRLCIASAITTETEFIKTKTIAQWKKDGCPSFKKVPSIFIIYK